MLVATKDARMAEALVEFFVYEWSMSLKLLTGSQVLNIVVSFFDIMFLLFLSGYFYEYNEFLCEENCLILLVICGRMANIGRFFVKRTSFIHFVCLLYGRLWRRFGWGTLLGGGGGGGGMEDVNVRGFGFSLLLSSFYYVYRIILFYISKGAAGQ